MVETQKQHLVLARKYRPQKFKEVVQQQTAVQALQNALNSGRIGSAYLFYGPRGIGKTTIARILAKRINCMNPVDGEPCDACQSCLSILSSNSMDVMEIDAASHRGIDAVREMRENVKFQPMVSSKKVYIIDEVHMLTMEAFNALLKTLEEPPAHVLFILATTELNKIPETIRSRCQVFTFKKVPQNILSKYIGELCEKEGIKVSEEALFWVARKGDGSVRDGLSFMEQAITYCGSEVTGEKIRELIGAIPHDIFLELTFKLLNKEESDYDMLAPVEETFRMGGDLNRFIWEYLEFLRTLIHIRNGVEDTEFIGLPETDIIEVRKEVSSVDPASLTFIFQEVYEILGKTRSLRLRNSYESRILIEVSFMDLKEKLTRPSMTGVLKKLNRLSAAIHQGVPYSPENDLQKKVLGTVLDDHSLPPIPED